MLRTKFDKWFKAQFGKLPNPNKQLELAKEAELLRSKLRQVEEELDDVIGIQMAYTAASYAANASKKDFVT